MPVVSILMPVYRTAQYLREATDSILAQTFSDFELIVLDDCSPDDASLVLDTYSDPRIVRYRGAENVGLANILNIGIDMARGRYIARMDSDDISLPNRIATQVSFLESHPDIDLCSTAMQLFGERSEVWRRNADPEKVKLDALFFSPVLHASSMWRRDRFEDAHLRFRQSTVPAEDYDLWTRALVAGLTMTNLPEPLYLYRIRPGQATSQPNSQEATVRQQYINATLPALRHTDNLHLHIIDCLLANSRSRFFNSCKLLQRLLKLRRNR